MVLINTRVNLLRIELNDDENKFKNDEKARNAFKILKKPLKKPRETQGP